MTTQRKLYNESLRRSVVKEIESGEISLADASRRYGLTKTSIHLWMQEYGAFRPKREVVEVVMKSEEDKIRELEKALSEAHLKIRAYEELLKIAERQYGGGLKKKHWQDVVRTLRKEGRSVEASCQTLGVTRDAYYKRLRRGERKHVSEAVVLKLVENVRKDEPRVGTRKLHHRIKPTLKKSGMWIGRDGLFDILRNTDNLVKPKRSYQKTTYSRHSYVVAQNLVKDRKATGPGKILVSDITYLRLQDGSFAYLFLTTDKYSRMIVGYHVSLDLSHYSALVALEMAVSRMGTSTGVIHHSDRGSQYCCHEFRTALSGYGMLSSMTDEAHCYQNAIAERINGILKDEFDLDAVFPSFYEIRAAVARAILVYNTKRTHFSLGLRTPMEVHKQAA